MEHDGKNKIWYKGIIPTCFLLIAIPIVAVVLLYFPMKMFLPSRKLLNLHTAKLLGHGIGFIFHLSCSIAGAFTTAREITKDRLREFKDNLSLSLIFAIKSYFFDMREKGVAYLIYVLIILVNLFLCIQTCFVIQL